MFPKLRATERLHAQSVSLFLVSPSCSSTEQPSFAYVGSRQGRTLLLTSQRASWLTFAGAVQLFLPKQEPVALHGSRVELQAENDIAGGRAELLVIAFHLVQEGKRKQAMAEGQSSLLSTDVWMVWPLNGCGQEFTSEDTTEADSTPLPVSLWPPCSTGGKSPKTTVLCPAMGHTHLC